MSNPQWNEIKRLFGEASSLPDADRDAFLRRECKGNIALWDEVTSLLKERNSDGFLTDGLLAAVSGSDPPEGGAEQVGNTIGPYVLVQLIGEGGCGVVFRAEQTAPVRRTVALKLIKRAMHHASILSRFESERQALAIMDHPHIARVLDAGTTLNGWPYFVMDYVEGISIAKFCDANGLSVRDRLQLVIQICAAIQYAHSKGVIHRDIKPENVIVCLVDGVPFAKVIDFGIAHAAESPPTELNLPSDARVPVGTPEYMSPEQAAASADVDTRSDVFAIGALAYVLLCGKTPQDSAALRAATARERASMIANATIEPPSARVARDTDFTIAATRSTTPGELRRLLAPELDCIVMKAINRDRTHRYETANELAADLGSFLNDDIVRAMPQTRGYTFAKRFRRNKGVVIGICAVILALLGGLISTSWWAKQAETARARASAEESRTRDALDRAQKAENEAQANLARARGSEQRTLNLLAIAEARSKGDTPPAALPAAEQASTTCGLAKSGAWTTDGTLATQSVVDPQPQWLEFGDTAWSTYELTFRARNIAGVQGPSCRVLVQDARNYYAFALGSYRNTGHDLARWSKGQFLRERRNFEWGRIEPGQWYSVRVVVESEYVRCFVDGAEKFSTLRVETPSGRVALATWNASVEFTDIKVTSLAGQTLWTGMPCIMQPEPGH